MDFPEFQLRLICEFACVRSIRVALLHAGGLGRDQVHQGVDQRKVRECLREVAEKVSAARVDLFGIKTEMARPAEHPAEQALAVIDFAVEDWADKVVAYRHWLYTHPGHSRAELRPRAPGGTGDAVRHESRLGNGQRGRGERAHAGVGQPRVGVVGRPRDELGKLKSSAVDFNGKKTGWDVSFLKGEFTHHNGESMLSVSENSSENYYFFIQD